MLRNPSVCGVKIRALLLLLYDVLLICLSVEDYQRKKIRNRFVLGILFQSILAACMDLPPGLYERVLGMLIISVPMFLTSLLLPGSFGGGDIKLVFASGAFLGWRAAMIGTVIAVMGAGVYALYLICTKRNRNDRQFAFGPFLSAGFLLVSFLKMGI